MDAMGLPMSFGKKTKGAQINIQSKLEKTKRDDQGPVIGNNVGSRAGPSVPRTATSDEVGENGGEEDGDDDDDDDIGLRPPVSTSGKRKAEERLDGGVEGGADGKEDDEDDDSDGFEEDDGGVQDGLPASHEIILKDHTKVVSAIAIDPSGARFASGSHDYDTKMWDFGGMDSRLKPFKSWEANGNYYVHDLDYSPDGQHLLVISGTLQPKVFNREGEEEQEFNKGDVYLRDMKNTSGHTAEINGGSWHPTDKNLFLTCSNDSTLRIWDVTNKRKQKSVIVVKSKERGARTRVTCCAWSNDGKIIAGACMDGTLHVWNTSSNLARPNYSCEHAHVKGTETTSVAFARDGFHLATRGADDTVKLWDIRSIRKPVAVASNLPNVYPETNLIYSPDGRSIITGVAAKKGEKGAMVVLSADDLSEQRRIAIGEGSVVRVLWHSRINQLFATLSTGAIHVLYSPGLSIHGALLPLQKMPRTAPRDPSFTTADLKPVIYTPDALPMFADVKYGESLHQRDKRAKKFKPMEPMTGAGKGGRLGASATQGFVQTLFPDVIRNEDPREALLKYADKTDEKDE